jgi:hypothetical protein
MIKRSGPVVAVLFAQFFLLVGCLNHPRNNQVQPSKSSTVSFDGYYLSPSQVIHIYILNNVTGAYDPIAHAPIVSAAASASVKDNSGALWYPFAANDVVLPSGPQYWSAGPAGSMVNVAHVQAIGDNAPDQPLHLVTFDVDADSCINSALQTSGMQVVTSCKSSASPIVTLNASCGANNGDCCLGTPACAFGENCSGVTCNSPCGGENHPCCRAAPFCGSGDVCFNQSANQVGVCLPCGGLGQKCCSGGGCKAGGVCGGDGTCQCGGLGQPCCAVSGCNTHNTVCSGGRCASCGAIHSLCCANNSCNGGTCVTAATPPQCACGDLNQACCPGNSCLGGTGYTCQNGTCAPPAKPPTCSAAGAPCGPTVGPLGTPVYCCPNSGLICNFNKCTPCVAHGAGCAHEEVDICCTAGERCVIDNNPSSNGAAVCGNPDPPPNP